jgi:pimeloyl-ACP methyl ester carboxylesterase
MDVEGERAEVFVQAVNSLVTIGGSPRKADLYVLKLIGASGRAETAGTHPLDVWTDMAGEVWAANPPGYGRSSGRARLSSLLPTALAAFDYLRTPAGDRPVLVTGRSLGGALALCLAALRPVAGLVVRDPPHLRDVILTRFGWPTGWFPAAALAAGVPEELDTTAAAQRCHAPAVFLTSARDRVVPPACQRRLLAHYAGEKQIVQFSQAGHLDPPLHHEQQTYLAALAWLRGRLHAGTF